MRIVLLAACALMAWAGVARAQSIEPRAYSPAPTGLNFLVVGYARTDGGVAFDDALPIENEELTTQGPVIGYARTLDLWGRAGKFDVIVPYSSLSGSALYQGQPISREIDGFHDPTVRISTNLYGVPALTPAEFRSYKQDVVVGASVQVSVPLGQYDETRLINLGANRWSVRPEIGASKAVGQWSFEAAGGVTVYTDNDAFYGGNKRSQRPIYSTRAHVIYNLRPGAWVSVDATYFAGGRTTLNGVLNDDGLGNWRVGTTLTLPVTSGTSLKFYASKGVWARTGNNLDLLGVAWQYRWGADP